MNCDRAISAVRGANQEQLTLLIGITESFLFVAGGISKFAENAPNPYLNSLWRMPEPADILCTSPERITEPIPKLSLCSNAPDST